MVFLTVCLFLGGPAHAGSDVEALLRAGRVAEAIPAARAEADSHPGDLDIQERFIDVALSTGLRDEAVQRVRGRLKVDKTDADAHYLMGRLALSADEANAWYDKALSIDPEHARAPMGHAAIHRALGDYQEAIVDYRLALSRDSGLVEAWGGLQAAYLRLDQPEQARKVAREALNAVPNAPEPYLAVATLEPGSARQVLTRGTQAIPRAPRLRLSLARAHLDAGDGAAAVAAAEDGLALAPHNVEGQYLAMVARDMKGGDLDASTWSTLDEAVRALGSAREPAALREVTDTFVRLTQQTPACVLCWIGRARAAAALGDPEAAVGHAQRAARLAPTEPEVQATVGLLLLSAERSGQALPWIERAMTARPADTSLALAAMRAQEADGDPRGARQRAVELLERFPYASHVAVEVAGLMGRQGDPEAAYLVLSEAVQRQADPTTVVALAAAARDAGHLAEASQILDALAQETGSDRARQLARQLAQEATAQRP